MLIFYNWLLCLKYVSVDKHNVFLNIISVDQLNWLLSTTVQ